MTQGCAKRASESVSTHSRIQRREHRDIERLSHKAARYKLVRSGVCDQTPFLSYRAATPVELCLITPERTDVVTVEGLEGLQRCREIGLEASLFVVLEKKRGESKRGREELKGRPH